MARKVPSFCLQLSKPFAFSSTLSLLKKKPFLSVGLIREYHGLKFLRPVQGTPSHISAEDPEPTGPPQPMTFEQFKREYEDVLSVFRFRPGMTNPFVEYGYKPFHGIINDRTKEEIYNLHIKDPEMWTVRRLANVYDTEMVRIEAVLRLKHLEKEQISKGAAVNQQTTEQYEAICGYPPYVTRDEYWEWKKEEAGEDYEAPKPYEQLPKLVKPLFVYVPEEEDLGQKALFKGRPYGERYDKPITNTPGKTLRKDSLDTSKRWKFLFLETGQRNKGEVYIREKDGKLRTASVTEKEIEQRHFGVWKDQGIGFFIRRY